MDTRIKKYLILAVIALLGTIILIASITALNSSKNQLTIYIAPQDVTVKYNDASKKVSSGDSLKLSAGTYNISFEKENFYSQNVEVEVPKDKDLRIVLEPSNQQGRDELSSKDNAGYLQSVGDLQFINDENIAINNPITQKLPYNNLIFSITYEPDNELDEQYAIKLLVDAQYGYREGAMNIIRSWGYDPAEYNIVFKEYSNPFEL